jgi:ribonuclease HI
LLEEGLIWRVGNGEKIKVWKDKWISTSTYHKISDPVRVLSTDAKVAEIINRSTNWWDIPLIEQIFPRETVDKICSIPICPRTQEDRLIWAGTKLGSFSVRSAYHLEMECRARIAWESSSASQSNPYWQHLWKLKVSRSVSLFLWRACNEILPTNKNLFKRKVVPAPVCPLCGVDEESTSHVLWRCPTAQAIWSCCGRSINKSVVMEDNFFGIFCYLCDRLDTEEMEFAVIVAHKIWLRRNLMVFGGSIPSPSILVKGAKEVLEEFRKSFEEVPSREIEGPRATSRWSKPDAGFIKLNWDAALDARQNRMGVGIIARDELGKVRAALSTALPYIQNPSVAEAFGARRAVEFARERGFSSIVIEGDSREVVLALGNSGDCCVSYGDLISNARALLSSFPHWKIAHVGREGNKAAHYLAKFAVSQLSSRVWIGVCPSAIVDIVCSNIDYGKS